MQSRGAITRRTTGRIGGQLGTLLSGHYYQPCGNFDSEVPRSLLATLREQGSRPRFGAVAGASMRPSDSPYSLLLPSGT